MSHANGGTDDVLTRRGDLSEKAGGRLIKDNSKFASLHRNGTNLLNSSRPESFRSRMGYRPTDTLRDRDDKRDGNRGYRDSGESNKDFRDSRDRGSRDFKGPLGGTFMRARSPPTRTLSVASDSFDHLKRAAVTVGRSHLSAINNHLSGNLPSGSYSSRIHTSTDKGFPLPDSKKRRQNDSSTNSSVSSRFIQRTSDVSSSAVSHVSPDSHGPRHFEDRSDVDFTFQLRSLQPGPLTYRDCSLLVQSSGGSLQWTGRMRSKPLCRMVQTDFQSMQFCKSSCQLIVKLRYNAAQKAVINARKISISTFIFSFQESERTKVARFLEKHVKRDKKVKFQEITNHEVQAISSHLKSSGLRSLFVKEESRVGLTDLPTSAATRSDPKKSPGENEAIDMTKLSNSTSEKPVIVTPATPSKPKEGTSKLELTAKRPASDESFYRPKAAPPWIYKVDNRGLVSTGLNLKQKQSNDAWASRLNKAKGEMSNGSTEIEHCDSLFGSLFPGKRQPKVTTDEIKTVSKKDEPAESTSAPIVFNISPNRKESMQKLLRLNEEEEDTDDLVEKKPAVSITQSTAQGTVTSEPQGNGTVVSRLSRSRKASPYTSSPVNSAFPDTFHYVFNDKKSSDITPSDFGRLEEGEFLNDTMINFFLKLLHQQIGITNPEVAKSTHIFNTFFYEKLMKKNESGGFEQVKKWTAKTDLMSMKYIVVPIHSKMHWYVAVIYNAPLLLLPKEELEKLQKPETVITEGVAEGDHKPVADEEKDIPVRVLRKGTMEVLSVPSRATRSRVTIEDVENTPMILIFDSLRSNAYSQVYRSLKEYIVDEAKDKKGVTVDRESIRSKTVIAPQQKNYCDCGVYLIHYVEKFLSDPERFMKHIVDRSTEGKEVLEKMWDSPALETKRTDLMHMIRSLREVSVDKTGDCASRAQSPTNGAAEGLAALEIAESGRSKSHSSLESEDEEEEIVVLEHNTVAPPTLLRTTSTAKSWQNL